MSTSDPQLPIPGPDAAGTPGPVLASQRLSTELRCLLPADPDKVVTINDILLELEDRGVAMMLILFSLPFVQPIPLPGLSTPFGFVIGLLGVSMALGLHKPWLPKWIMKREVPRNILTMLVEKGGWLAGKVERRLKPRLLALTAHGTATRFHGINLAIMAFLLSLPIPPMYIGSNTAPAVSILLLSVAFLERDGYFVIASYIAQIGTHAYFAFIAYTLYLAGAMGIGYFFSAASGSGS
ncbi:MAG: exopolysaccharide biosynthesis protein [Candidatus Methylacidiphilales bacterium]|nr:exopolysaccharide biosynthesis protein [Candidatus Methylacidiphilales bacterium]